MDTQKDPVNITQQHEAIVDMLSEIEKLQKDLLTINSNLLKATENTCSEYGDRILENKQSKLFYLQRVLKENTITLKKHEDLLKQIINKSVTKSKEELQDYYEYCRKTASIVRLKISKYKIETQRIIANNC